MTTLSTQQAQALLTAAQEAARHAYAPYSDFPVGAALLCADGRVITGTNVENASFGLTNCAERSALFAAISQGIRDFQAIAVWAKKRPHGAITPCGACRQVMLELLAGETPVYSHDPETGTMTHTSVTALLPAAFGADRQHSFPGTDNS